MRCLPCGHVVRSCAGALGRRATAPRQNLCLASSYRSSTRCVSRAMADARCRRTIGRQSHRTIRVGRHCHERHSRERHRDSTRGSRARASVRGSGLEVPATSSICGVSRAQKSPRSTAPHQMRGSRTSECRRNAHTRMGSPSRLGPTQLPALRGLSGDIRGRGWIARVLSTACRRRRLRRAGRAPPSARRRPGPEGRPGPRGPCGPAPGRPRTGSG
jgi:hypothetical protein